MTYTLVFGYSTSQDYARAVQLASSLPGYTADGVGRAVRHEVLVGGAAAPALAELLALVGAWRSSVLLADGAPLGRPAALRGVLACQRTRERSGLGELHCWGLPAVARGRVPCRLLDRALPWMLAGEYANSQLLPRFDPAHARQLLLDACTAYDEPTVGRAALANRGRSRYPLSAADWELGSEGQPDEDVLGLRLLIEVNLDSTEL